MSVAAIFCINLAQNQQVCIILQHVKQLINRTMEVKPMKLEVDTPVLVCSNLGVPLELLRITAVNPSGVLLSPCTEFEHLGFEYDYEATFYPTSGINYVDDQGIDQGMYLSPMDGKLNPFIVKAIHPHQVDGYRNTIESYKVSKRMLRTVEKIANKVKELDAFWLTVSPVGAPEEFDGMMNSNVYLKMLEIENILKANSKLYDNDNLVP